MVKNHQNQKQCLSVTVELKHAARQCISSKLYQKLQKCDLFNEYEELFHLNSHIALSLTSRGLEIPDLFTHIDGNMCQCCSVLGNVEFSTFITKVPVAFEIKMEYCAFRHSSMFHGNRQASIISGSCRIWLPCNRRNILRHL